MSAGSSTTSPDLLARWSHLPSCSSRTCLGCSLLAVESLFDESFMDWPRSGSWDATGLWRQPKLEPPTYASGGSVSPTMPTPTQSDGTGGPGETPKREGGRNLRTEVHLLATPTASVAKDGVPQDSKGKRDLRLDGQKMLPTPTRRDYKGQNIRNDDSCLHGALTLLPTPTAANPNDGESLESWEARRQRNLEKGINGNGQGTPLPIAVRLYPTPTSNDHKNAGYRKGKMPHHQPLITLPGATGSAPMAPLSSDGNTSSDDEHPTLFSMDD